MDEHIGKPHTHSIVPLLLFTVVATAIVVGGGMYMVGKQRAAVVTVQPTSTSTTVYNSADPTPSITTTPLLPTSASPSASSTQTIDWKLYTDTDYHVSFNYPASWPNLVTSTTAETADSPWWEFKSNWLTFGDYVETITLSSFDSYKKSIHSDAAMNIEVDRLATLFTSKDASMAPAFWLPPSNASISYHTQPTYIESENSTYRGVYYYAAIGQESPGQTNGAYQLNDFMVVMSDGKSTIFQLHKFADKSNASTKNYQAIDRCIDSSGSTASCVVDQQLLIDFKNEYKTVAVSVH